MEKLLRVSKIDMSNLINFRNLFPRSLASSALMAGSIVCSVATAGNGDAALAGISALVGLISSLAGNVAASDIYKAIAEQMSHETVLANGDLRKAIANTICSTIYASANNPGNFQVKEEILLLTENTAPFLEQLLNEEINDSVVSLAKAEIHKISPNEIVKIFTVETESFYNQKSALSIEAWEEIVMWLAAKKAAVMSLRTSRLIAEDLYNHFSKNFLQILKFDNKAYASLQNNISNRILASQKEIFAAVSVVSQQIDNLDRKVKGNHLSLIGKLDDLPTGVANEFRQELEKILQNYRSSLESNFKDGESYKKEQNELKCLKLKESLSNAVLYTLNKKIDNTFFRKYVPETIYQERREVEIKFRDFTSQTQKRCFVAIGKAGTGKTCQICRFAESLANHNSNFLPLLISAENLRLRSENGGELKKAIIDNVISAVPELFNNESFESFAEFLTRRNLNIVILIDGLNELQGKDSHNFFNAQFEDLLELVARRDFPVHFALTCRYESWQHFTQSNWAANHIYDKDAAEQVTMLIEPFSVKEVEVLTEKYFDFFAIDGKITGEAKNTCRLPLMLRLLCDAYTNRSAGDKDSQPSSIKTYKLKEISSLKKKEILKQYVASRREEFQKINKNTMANPSPSEIYRLTTLYIINIANFMYQKQKTRITAEEVVEVAGAMNHSDAKLGAERVAAEQGSSFLSLIELGVFSRNGAKGNEEFSFVYETYFEFSLGRYIAFVRWRDITAKSLEFSKIEADLKVLIDEHATLSKDGNFSNLFGAIQFAILATESGEWMSLPPNLPDEEKIYHSHPALFSKLVKCLAETKKSFDWLQQACATIRESELAESETWNRLEKQGGIEKARIQFDELLTSLSNLAGMTDFVLLWDIENTLQTLARANFGLTLTHLKAWAKSDEKLKVIFASQVISRLALINPEKAIKLLLDWIKTEQMRSDFWITRSLLFAVSEITRLNRKNKLEENDDWTDLREEIHRLVNDNFEGKITPYAGSRALALLPNMSFSQSSELNKIDKYVEKLITENDSWQLLNFLFETLKHSKEESILPEEWIIKTLDKISEHQNYHVLYVIERIIDSINVKNVHSRETLNIKSKIKTKLKGARWRTNEHLDHEEKQNGQQIGVVYHPRYLEPDYENHIECRERLLAILNKIESCGEKCFARISPLEAETADLEEVHKPGFDFHRDGSPWNDYVETIEEISENKIRNEEPFERTGASELRFESFDIAKLAAGGVMSGIDYVIDNEALAAVVLNRPPGHLANNTICIFNNIAIGAHYALNKYDNLDRILIVDCDAHHGKHTQQVFYRSPNVVYFSMHIDGEYAKESGMIENDGADAGKGYTFNIPYPPDMSDAGYELIIDSLLMPVAYDFQPQLILLSAGFDGHFNDPLTPNCRLSEQSYIYLAKKLKEIAVHSNCKIVTALEGGYGLEGMSKSLTQMMNVWGEWNISEKIGFTQIPDGYENKLSSKAVEIVRKTLSERTKMMFKAKRNNKDYFFNPDSPHWKNILYG